MATGVAERFKHDSSTKDVGEDIPIACFKVDQVKGKVDTARERSQPIRIGCAPCLDFVEW